MTIDQLNKLMASGEPLLAGSQASTNDGFEC